MLRCVLRDINGRKIAVPEINVRKAGVSVDVEASGNTGHRITVKMVMWLPAFFI